MFMHGPSTQCSWECVDIALVYVRRISSPGLARITGGSSRPLNENAALPVLVSLIAFKDTGERVSGGSDTRAGLETAVALSGPPASSCTPQNKPRHVTHARKLRPTFTEGYVMLCFLPPRALSTPSMSGTSAPLLPKIRSNETPQLIEFRRTFFVGRRQFTERMSGFRHIGRLVSCGYHFAD
jgi:hypothetical protein